jgi:membrane protease YdiL (CAAX protease family)
MSGTTTMHAMDDTSGSLPVFPAGERGPGLGIAAGLIATYFGLQIAVGSLFVLVFGAIALLGQPAQGHDAMMQSVLHRPAMQALMAMLSLGVAAPLTLLLARRKWPWLWSLARPPGFGFTPPRHAAFFALAVLAGLLAPLLGGLLTDLLAHGRAVTQDIQQLGSNTPLGLRIPLTLVVVTVGPLVEELLFRGVLLSAVLRRCRVGWAVALTSLLFALIHLPGLQFQWYGLPDLTLLALLLAWLRLHSGSIWPAVLAHGVNNLLAVLPWFVAINLPG